AIGVGAVAAVRAGVPLVGGCAAALLEDALDGAFRDDALRVVAHHEAAPARRGDEGGERFLAAAAAGPIAALVSIWEQAGLASQGRGLAEPAEGDQLGDVVIAGILPRV